MKIITEGMRKRERICKFAKKNGVAKTAIRYKTSRQNVYRWLKRYDGTVESMRKKSTRPKVSPNEQTKEELELIKKCYNRFKSDGIAEVYAQLRRREYKRSFQGMKRAIKRMKLIKREALRKLRTKNRKAEKPRYTYPGEMVQVDIKYVPRECLKFRLDQKSYYQITAIDLMSSRRVLHMVDEKSMYHTVQFIKGLEEAFGFKIRCIQTDNGAEFTGTHPKSNKTEFERVLESLGIQYQKTQPYSPWQNGAVERSHRIDNDRFYSKRTFYSEEDLIKAHKRYSNRYNNIAIMKHNFKSPNQVVEEYFFNQVA